MEECSKISAPPYTSDTLCMWKSYLSGERLGRKPSPDNSLNEGSFLIWGSLQSCILSLQSETVESREEYTICYFYIVESILLNQFSLCLPTYQFSKYKAFLASYRIPVQSYAFLVTLASDYVQRDLHWSRHTTVSFSYASHTENFPHPQKNNKEKATYICAYWKTVFHICMLIRA